MKDTSQQGLISHTAILNRLVQLGFEVLLPWADHLGYDLAYYVVEDTEILDSSFTEKRVLFASSVRQGGW